MPAAASRPTFRLFKKPAFPDVGKAFQVAATINRQPFMMVVDAKSPYKTVADVTEAMKKKGDKATYASAAPTGTVMGELYKVATGIKAVEVSYKTAPDSLNDMTERRRRLRHARSGVLRSPSSAKAGCAFSASAPASGSMPRPTCRPWRSRAFRWT